MREQGKGRVKGMATRKKETFIEVLMEHETIPENAMTFGRLIAEACRQKDAEQELSARQKTHAALYSRWCGMASRHVSRRFPPGDPIYTDIRVWEMYVCRFDPDTALWFYHLQPLDRIDLCELSRQLRRNLKR
jgi:hypothetical protein